jgi:deoxyribose-phosphate aldolase
MVINMAELKAGHDNAAEEDIRAVVAAARGTLVKVIIETCYLTDAEKKRACEAAVNAGAQFVKTSTGFGTGGATVEDVRLMRAAVPAHMQVKASGGVRTYEEALAMIEAGAGRLGTSAGIAIVENAE